MRPYQLVIFGSSGFTGQRIVENLALFLKRSSDVELRWAVSGRNVDKVRRSLEIVSRNTNIDVTSVPVLRASLEDTSSLLQMASKAEIVMNCTGPFRETGEAVVSQCIDAATNYVDIAGEPQFMESAQLKYHKQAVDKKIYIIPGSGTDCIPSDCGINYLRDRFDGKLNSVQIFLSNTPPRPMTGNVTTWYSLVDGFGDTKTLINIRKQLFRDILHGVPSRPKFEYPLKPISPFSRYSDSRTSGFVTPFKGADPSVIRRSQIHNQILYGEEPVDTKVYQLLSLRSSLNFVWLAFWVSLLAPTSSGRKLLKKYPSFFSAGVLNKGGPSEQELKTFTTTFTLKGQGWRNGSDLDQTPTDCQILRLTGPHGGYPYCAIVINQAVMTMLNEREQLPGVGGVYTPGTAFRRTKIIDRIAKNGIDVSIEKL